MSHENLNEALIAGDLQQIDDDRETLIRPKKLHDFQGQQTLKENLTIFMTAAKQREEALDHVFISGPPGLGKTTLASIIAYELETELRVSSAPALDKPKDLAGILTTLTPNSVFFIDEIHRLRPAVEEMLYIAMEDYALDWVIGQGPAARTVRIPLPPFTLVGATTKPGKVAAPLHTRFGITQRINYYSVDEVADVIHRTAQLLEINIDDAAIQLLSQCSRGTPRVANRLLRRMRDFAQVQDMTSLSYALIEKSLKRLKIDHKGLEDLDRDIIKTIINNYNGGPVGVETLAISVGESTDSIEDFYEPYLIQQGLMKRTPRGRTVTDLAYSHLNLTRKDDANQGLLF